MSIPRSIYGTMGPKNCEVLSELIRTISQLEAALASWPSVALSVFNKTF